MTPHTLAEAQAHITDLRRQLDDRLTARDELIRKARLDEGWTIRQIAEATGLSTHSVAGLFRT